jgi:hypothetical protein
VCLERTRERGCIERGEKREVILERMNEKINELRKDERKDK